MPFSFFLALKYLRPKRSFLSVVTVISVLGIVIGVAILVIVMSVMEGFDDMWREKILGFSAHLTVSRPGEVLDNAEELAERLAKMDGISGAVPHVQTIVLMESGRRVAAPFVVGMAGEEAGLVSEIPESIVAGAFDLGADKIVLGWDLAGRLGLGVGDTVLVYSPRNVMARDEIYLPEELEVSGIYKLGMWEYDSRFALTSIQMARDLYGLDEGALAIRIMTEDPFMAHEHADAIMAELGPGYQALTWMDLNQTLFDALRVEKDLMRFLLACIAVVAFFCVANTLIVITVQKTQEIGLLKAIGFSEFKIMGVFIWHGMIQCLVGTGSGIGGGMLLLHYRNEVVSWLSSVMGVELFPASIYQLSKIPAHTTPQDLLSITLLVFVFCLLASVIPAARAAWLDPVKALHSD